MPITSANVVVSKIPNTVSLRYMTENPHKKTTTKAAAM